MALRSRREEKLKVQHVEEVREETRGNDTEPMDTNTTQLMYSKSVYKQHATQ